MKKKLPSIPHPKGRAAFGYGRLEITDLVNTYEKDCEFYFQSMEGLAWGGYWTDSPASGNLPFRKRLHGYALRKTLKKGDHLITNCLAFQNIYDQADVVDDLYSHGIYIHFLDLDVGTDTEEGVALIGRLLATIDGSRKRSGIQFLEASAFATLKGRLPGKLPWGYKQRKGKIIWDWARRNQAREYMQQEGRVQLGHRQGHASRGLHPDRDQQPVHADPHRRRERDGHSGFLPGQSAAAGGQQSR
jgi:hypothetical protein